MAALTEELQRLVAVRHGYLAALLGEPKRKPDLVARLEHSRSTVDYAIRELLAAELIERSEEGYRVTPVGFLAYDAYDSYVARLDALQRASTALNTLAADSLRDSGIFEGASVLLPKPHAPLWPLKEFLAELADARLVRGFSPVMVEPYVSTLHSRLRDDTVRVEVALPSAVLEYLLVMFADELAEMLTSSSLTVLESNRSVPFGLWLYGDNCCRVAIVFHTEGTLGGVVVNDSDAIRRWAADRFDEVRDDAEQVAPSALG